MRLLHLIAASLLTCVASPLAAQTFGPPIKGLCLLSRANAISASRANQSLQAQLQQMRTALSGELARQRTAIDQQRRALDARQNTIAPIEYQRQKAALDRQAQTLDQQQNGRFIAAQTRGKQQLDNALNQALGRVVTRSACSLVLERDNAYGWNNAMDITSAVTQEMNAILSAVALQ